MANRFTDTEKWRDPWFRNLKGDYKLAWGYIIDSCDHAGIWKIDMEMLNFCTKPSAKLNEEEMFTAFNKGKKRVITVDESRWYVAGFIEFQYKQGFNPKNNAHRGVIKQLRKHQLTKHLPRGWSGANKGLTRGTAGAKDKDKDKDNRLIIYSNKIIDYFNKTTNSHYKHSDTARGPILARLRDGFTPDQCAEVIRKKHEQWADDEKMCRFIRIETLFAPTKFEGYLNEKVVSSGYKKEDAL